MEITGQQKSPRLKYQILISAIWGCLLFYYGIIGPLPEPFILSFIVYISIGLPTVMFYAWEVSKGYLKFTMSEFLMSIFVFGPMMTIISSLILGSIIAFIVYYYDTGEFLWNSF